jgi:NADPH:quinone reductase-like Zn-dependent oxidoreductase
MSRIVEFAEAGGPEVLKFKDVDVPEAGAGQVRIRVKAIGLNRAESMWRENKYIEPVQFPARLGYEAVGAKSIALTRISAKQKQLTDAGAKYVIATEEEDLVKEINEITGGQGARFVFDPVGGPKLQRT